MTDRQCAAQRYSQRKPCSDVPEFNVVYRSTDGRVLDRHPACFTHGLAEVDRHHASAGMASCDLEPAER